jgi:hypothetical protein
MANEQFIKLYQERLNKGREVFSKKFQEIKKARNAFNQVMEDEDKRYMSNATSAAGNVNYKPDTTEISAESVQYGNFSTYFFPILTAIIDMYQKELNTYPFRYEWLGNDKTGVDTRKAMEHELRKMFAYENMKSKQNQNIFHNLVSGTAISQTISKPLEEKLMVPTADGFKEDIIKMGRSIDVIVYDTLRCIIDPNALPGDVTGTARWAIVTIGDFTPEEVKERWKITMSASSKNQTIDLSKKQLEVNTGVNRDNSITVREYYLTDGYRYVIVGDEVLAEKKPNSNAISGRIPLNVTVFDYDPDSIYGKPLYTKLQPSIEIASMALNQIADNNARNNNAPIFVSKRSGLAEYNLSNTDPNIMIPVEDFSSALGEKFDITKLVSKLQFPDISQSAIFLFNQAVQMIFQLAGTNPTALAGMQDKQIRTNDVAQLVSQAGIRSNSNYVTKFENFFMNPTCNDIRRIFYAYFEDFDFPKEISKDQLRNMKHVRVVNGSSLPADQMNRFGKTQYLQQLAVMHPTIMKQREIVEDSIDELNMGDPDRYIRTDEEAAALQEAQQAANLQTTGV